MLAIPRVWHANDQKIEKMAFSTLKAGEVDPELNKKIRRVIIQHDDFLVYLDEDLEAQWHVADTRDTPHFGKVLNAVADVALRSEFLRNEKNEVATFERIRLLTCEAIARVIDDMDESAAWYAIERANDVIAQKGAAFSRAWYYLPAQQFAAGLFAFALFVWVSRRVGFPWDSLVGRTALELLFCAVAGAVGALVSILTRVHHIKLDVMSGKAAHHIEACGRIFVGMTAATSFCLAMKTGWVSILHGDTHSVTFLALLGLICGASERLVPNFLSKFDPAGALSDISFQQKVEDDAGNERRWRDIR